MILMTHNYDPVVEDHMFGFGGSQLVLSFKQKLHVFLVLVVPVSCIASCEHINIIYYGMMFHVLWTYFHQFSVLGIALLEQVCEHIH